MAAKDGVYVNPQMVTNTVWKQGVPKMGCFFWLPISIWGVPMCNGYNTFGSSMRRAARQPAAKNLERSWYFSCLRACQTIVPALRYH